MKKRRLYFEHSFVLTALTIFFVSVRALDDPSGNRRAASQRSLAFRKPRNTRRIMRSNWPRGWLLVYKTPARVFALSFRYCRIVASHRLRRLVLPTRTDQMRYFA